MKKSAIDNVSYKAIMYLVFIRTTLDLAVDEVNESGVPIKHKLTNTAFIIYNQIVTLEKTIYRKNKALSERYIKAHEMCKPIWNKAKEDMGENYAVYLDPLAVGLYYDAKSDLKAIGLNDWLFNNMMDSYMERSDCELEAQSTRPAMVVRKEVEKALFEMKKKDKRMVA